MNLGPYLFKGFIT